MILVKSSMEWQTKTQSNLSQHPPSNSNRNHHNHQQQVFRNNTSRINNSINQIDKYPSFQSKFLWPSRSEWTFCWSRKWNGRQKRRRKPLIPKHHYKENPLINGDKVMNNRNRAKSNSKSRPVHFHQTSEKSRSTSSTTTSYSTTSSSTTINSTTSTTN